MQPPVTQLLEHLFRHEAGRLTAALCRTLGLEQLDLAEDVVQDALLQALRRWPYQGVPDNPAGWLWRVAHHRAIDLLRRRKLDLRAVAAVSADLEPAVEPAFVAVDLRCDGGVEDDTLAMMFACCHPAIPEDDHVALTLRAVGGFSSAEIARAFLLPEATLAQRLVRAKRRLAASGIVLALPGPGDVAGRLDSVLRVIYLIFNEGYAAGTGEDLVRHDLCSEAVRLAGLLLRREDTRLPKVHALLALLLLQAARLPARVDEEGDLLLLEQQDRSRWDASLLGGGVHHLEASAAGDEMTAYHVEAAIAAVHAVAPSYEATDWGRLLDLYDQLMTLKPTPVVALNRAVAVAMADGPATGLVALDQLSEEPALRDYYLLPATRGDLLRRLGRRTEAADCYRRALGVTCSGPARRFLERRLAEQLEEAPPCA